MTKAIKLLELPQFKRELAQVGARSALHTLGVAEESSVRWNYHTERIVRNLTAVTAELDSNELSGAQADGMRVVAQAWENLSELGDRVDRSTALINAALAYEWAGYQANAACLARLATPKIYWTQEPNFDGLVSAFIQRLFVQVRELQSRLTELPDPELLCTYDEIDRRAALAVTAISLSDVSSYFLTGDDRHIKSAIGALDLASAGLAQSGDAVAYNTVVGLKRVVPVMAKRSTWSQLGTVCSAPRWQRYLKVLARGLGDDILASRSISELWPSQLIAVAAGLLESDESRVVRMPTSAGKTRVAELAIVYSLIKRPGSKCVYVAPYHALANEIEQSFANLFHDLGYGASTVPGGYDYDKMGADLVTTDDVLVLTPEKLDLLFRLQPEWLEQVALIVIDEGHIVADRQRGPKFELLVSRLRRKIPKARFLMMSAVVPDVTLKDFAKWLGGSPKQAISTEWRPSLLRLGLLDWNGQSGTLRFSVDDTTDGELKFIPNLIKQTEYEHVAEETKRVRRPKFPSGSNKGEVAAEVAYRFAPLGPVLVFVMQTNWAESTAKALLRRIELAELTKQAVPEQFQLRTTSRAAAVASEWLGESHIVTQLLQRGIAFHHGRLPSAVRDALEDDFRARNLDVMVATSTLAQGVNLPVRTVVIHSCRSHEADGSSRVLSAREYWNIAGRAGRAGAETQGNVIHIASNPYDRDDFERYEQRRSDVERVESALYRMLQDLVAKRISSHDAARQLDADLLALLVEEGGSLDEQAFKETLSSSLFQIQTAEKKAEVKPLIDVMTSTARRISEDVPDVEMRRLFASTGLSSRSCKAIDNHVKANEAAVEKLLDDPGSDLNHVLDLLFDGLAEVSEMEPRAAASVDTRVLLSEWISGKQIKTICDAFGVDDSQKLTEYVEDAFSYRLPWGVSAYVKLASELTDTTVKSRIVENLAGMIKYGVPSPEAAWAMSAGVASRRAAVTLANEHHRTADTGTVTNFRKWLGRLDPDLLAERLGLTGAELESTARAILKSQPNDYLAKLDSSGELLPLKASCQPVRSAIDSGLVFEIASGDSLEVQRNRDSRLNRNAVLIKTAGRTLGYLQVDASRALAPELDTGMTAFAEVVEVAFEPGGQIDITVEIRATNST